MHINITTYLTQLRTDSMYLLSSPSYFGDYQCKSLAQADKIIRKHQADYNDDIARNAMFPDEERQVIVDARDNLNCALPEYSNNISFKLIAELVTIKRGVEKVILEKQETQNIIKIMLAELFDGFICTPIDICHVSHLLETIRKHYEQCIFLSGLKDHPNFTIYKDAIYVLSLFQQIMHELCPHPRGIAAYETIITAKLTDLKSSIVTLQNPQEQAIAMELINSALKCFTQFIFNREYALENKDNQCSKSLSQYLEYNKHAQSLATYPFWKEQVNGILFTVSKLHIHLMAHTLQRLSLHAPSTSTTSDMSGPYPMEFVRKRPT